MQGKQCSLKRGAAAFLMAILDLPWCPGAAAANQGWTFDHTQRLLLTATQSELIAELSNPENQTYELPTEVLSAEWRPEFRLLSPSKTSFILRPRLRLIDEIRDRESPRHQKSENDSEAYLNEAQLSLYHSQELQSVLGLQNFQWGPAELASPSNPFFRDLGLDKSIFYETRGKSLLRFNYSPSGQSSFIAIAEPLSNGERRPAFEHDFKPRLALKAEFSDASQTNYLGLVFSGSADEGYEQGVYAHYEVLTALTAYFDAAIRQGSEIWHPETDALGKGRFSQSRQNSKDYNTCSVLGLRYVTLSGIDLRLEWYQDEEAWTGEERDRARWVLGSSPTQTNGELYVKPGSLLPGRQFLYLAARVPDWGWSRDRTVSLRTLHSLSDQTTQAIALLETFVNDHLSVSAAWIQSLGPLNGELTQGYRRSASLSGAWTF